MSTTQHALILTGDLLPGYSAAQAWPALATFFRIDPQRLHGDVLARAPIALKQSDDLVRLEELQRGAAAVGAVIEIHPVDEGGSVFVLLDNTPRGPLPRGFVAQRVRAGAWPVDIRVAAVGSTQWAPFTAPATPAAPAFESPEPLAQAPYSAPAREWPASADRLDASERLPPGETIHAGFWRRSAAYLIDSLILFIPSLIVNFIPLLGVLVALSGRWLYFALMESSPSQATLGKRAMGLTVTDGNGRAIGFGQASGRYFGGAVSTILLYVGYMMAGWTQRKQALHDLMADTCVVFEQVKPGSARPIARPPMPWYGWLVNIVLLSVFPIAIVAILAAIALPAYQDYVTRAKLIDVDRAISPLKVEVAEARMSDQGCPGGPRDVSSAMIAGIVLAGAAPACTITVTTSSASNLPAAVQGQAIEWTYSQSGTWTCSSPIPPKYLPRSCR